MTTDYKLEAAAYEEGFRQGVKLAREAMEKEFLNCGGECRNYPLLIGRMKKAVDDMRDAYLVGLNAMEVL